MITQTLLILKGNRVQEFIVTPKFLHFRVANDSLKQSQTYQTCKKRLLLEEIRIKKKNLKTLVRELSVVKEELLRSISFLDVNHVFNLIVSTNEKSILKCRHVQHQVIPGYKPETSLDCHDPEKVIFLLVFCQIRKKDCYVKVLGLLYHPKRLIMQTSYCNSNFCNVILCNLI